MNTMRNKVQLIGHLGADPEIKNLENGGKLARFSLATNEKYQKKNGEKVTETHWHNLIAWGKTADIIEKYARKGNELGVEGKLKHRAWETKEGEKRYATEVVVNDVLLMKAS